jgi:hypothetical protein
VRNTLFIIFNYERSEVTISALLCNFTLQSSIGILGTSMLEAASIESYAMVQTVFLAST